MLINIIIGIQLVFTVVVGMYFLTLLRGRNTNKKSIAKDGEIQEVRLKEMRSVHLTTPLSETTRPKTLGDIVGQDKGLLGLRAALCSADPQHVIIYGEPGVGKTAAARVVLEEAKKSIRSPFQYNSKFIEIDAANLRSDDRGIADPLIGSVHDPIYQGAGLYGKAGIPMPKAGAVSKAHGGVLFIDEIGELQYSQMNKLLKVLEDRKVMFESSYYSENNNNIPSYIHDIFKNGLPADFRLVGATTRQPNELPAALRSRCMEIFFDALGKEDIKKITLNAIKKARFISEEGAVDMISTYSQNGRDAVNMVQMASSIASLEYRGIIRVKDVEWVIETGQYPMIVNKKLETGSEVGKVNGLAICGSRKGFVMDIEVTAKRAYKNKGEVVINGIIEEESIQQDQISRVRKSKVRSSIENALTLLSSTQGIDLKNYNIYINYPGGIPVDGTSSGMAVFVAVYSAIFNKSIESDVAMTGEVGIQGKIYPVGGVYAKIWAAKVAGASKVIIPKENNQAIFEEIDIEIITVSTIEEVIFQVFNEVSAESSKPSLGEVLA